MSEWLNMGGFAEYIWPAWGIAVVVLTALIVTSVRAMRARERELAELEATVPRRSRRRANAEAGADADARETA